ncbi:MAG TPA: hypothetical protein VG602_01260 [Actinomycetota bacterium]|nr:hypothetical protein [Actinomycetota bacterium]
MPAGVGLEVFVAFVLVGCLVGAVFAGQRLREIPMPDVRGRRVELPDRVRALGEMEQPGDADWRWLEQGLIRAGATRSTASEVVTRVRERHEPGHDPAPLLIDELARIFEGDPGFELPGARPAIVLVVATGRAVAAVTIAKLARRFSSEGRSVGVATADPGRAKDVREWARRAGAQPIESGQPGTRVSAAVEAARTGGHDVLILDAGRAPPRQDPRVVRGGVEITAARPPDAVILGLDATLVSHVLPQSRALAQAAGATGLVLVGMDTTHPSAVAVSVREELDLPVWFAAAGQTEDLEAFDPRAHAAALVQ